MSDALKLGFAPFAAPAKIGAAGVLIVFCDDAPQIRARHHQGDRRRPLG